MTTLPPLHADQVRTGYAAFRTVTAYGVDRIVTDPADLEEPGFYAVVLDFEGDLVAARMHDVTWHHDEPWRCWRQLRGQAATPRGDKPDAWVTSLGQAEYERAVQRVHDYIAAGTVYQANICRVISRQLGDTDLDLLFDAILAENPAPYACRLELPEQVGTSRQRIVSASPELFLSRAQGRIVSAPIKGTAPTVHDMLPKDATENIMITDLVRNDLQRVCEPGSVIVEELLAAQSHPGLVHLVSTVSGRLAAGTSWADIVSATFPPGSVTGAPKHTALQIISELEPSARGPYCGAVGWVDTASGQAELAVGIRTFWVDDKTGQLRFGTGAGITWDSDPVGEWRETQLKAAKLVHLADRA